jgi:hypothetical protein
VDQGPRRNHLTVALASALAGLAALTVALSAPSAARAGTWTLASCTQPNGQPAPTDGWATGWFNGSQTGGSGDTDTCAQGGSLAAIEEGFGNISQGPEWVFTAPPSQTIAGGTISGTVAAPSGETWMSTPNNGNNAADVFAYCAFNSSCGPNFTQTASFGIQHPGGTNIYAVALCHDPAGATTCPATNGLNASVSIHAALIELSDTALPTGSGFSGPLLSPNAHGVAGLLFTAADPNEPTLAVPSPGYGPGLYAVTAQIDGVTAYQGTPDTNGGACVALGSGAGGLIFDHMQPCKPLDTVDVPVDTRVVPDGEHELTVTVTDAAGNAAPVLDQEISTLNPTTTPVIKGRHRVHAQLVVSWHWNGPRTLLRWVKSRRMPHRGRVAVRCRGRGCPHLKVTRVRIGHVAKLWRALGHKFFSAGNKLDVTISAPHLTAEHLEFTIRTGRKPAAHVLKR